MTETTSRASERADCPRRRALRRPALAAFAALTVTVLGACGPTDDPVAEPTRSPSPTSPSPGPSDTSGSSDEADDSTSRRPFDVVGLQIGPEPTIPWADGRDVHLADGTTLRDVLPVGAHEFARMGSGVMAVSSGEDGRSKVRFYHRDGGPGPRGFPIDGGLATSPEGQVVAWVRPDGTPVVVQSEGDERYQMPKIPAEGGYDAVAVTSEDCKEGRTTDAGCSVLANTVGEVPQAWLSTSHGFADRIDERILTLTAWRDGSYAGITEYRDDNSTCSAAVSQTSNETHFETCDRRLVGYSPDGRYLLTVGSTGDGLGDGEVGIVDAVSGDVIVDLASTEETPAFATRLVWEDDEHALLLTYAEGAWAVVRLGVDGLLSYAVPPREGSDLEPPFILAS